MIPHDSPPAFQRYETFTARHFPKPTAFHSYLSLLERIHSSPNCPIIINYPNCPSYIQKIMLEVLRQNPGLPVNDHVPDIVSCLLSPSS